MTRQPQVSRIRTPHTVRFSEHEKQAVLAIQRRCQLPSLEAAIRYAVLELARQIEGGEHATRLDTFQRAIGDGT